MLPFDKDSVMFNVTIQANGQTKFFIAVEEIGDGNQYRIIILDFFNNSIIALKDLFSNPRTAAAAASEVAGRAGIELSDRLSSFEPDYEQIELADLPDDILSRIEPIDPGHFGDHLDDDE